MKYQNICIIYASLYVFHCEGSNLKTISIIGTWKIS